MNPPRRYRILVCRGPDCERRGSPALHAELEGQIALCPPVGAEVELGWQSCFGHCTRGVNVMVRELKPTLPKRDSFLASFAPGGILYHGVKLEDVSRILDEHIEGGQPIEELRRRNSGTVDVVDEHGRPRALKP